MTSDPESNPPFNDCVASSVASAARSGPSSRIVTSHWIATGVAATVCGVVLLAAFSRLDYGVDLTDESHVLVLAKALAAGARPFVDELQMPQTRALLLQPFVAVWLGHGGVNGLVWAVRFAYFVLAVRVALVDRTCDGFDIGRGSPAGGDCSAGALFVFSTHGGAMTASRFAPRPSALGALIVDALMLRRSSRPLATTVREDIQVEPEATTNEPLAR